MNEKLDKLISLAITDGIITDKERDVLLRKATEEGVELDEFEMYFEAKLFEKQQELKEETAAQILPPPLEKKSNKEGDLKKCPSCGSPVPSFQLSCTECGHEFRNTEGNNSVKQLEEKLNKIPTDGGLQYETKIADIIKNHPIPNNKEDLFEILSYMSSKVLSSNDMDISGNRVTDAYQSRALEVITKLLFISDVEPHIIKRVEEIKKQMTKHKSKNKVKTVLTMLMLLGLIYGGLVFFKSFF